MSASDVFSPDPLPQVASNAFLIVPDTKTGSAKQYQSVPLEFDANPARFNATNGFFVLSNSTERFLDNYRRQNPLETSFPPIILGELWPGYSRPYIEERLLIWKRRFGDSLKAVVILGGAAMKIRCL
jgi:hypothetical protein